MASFLEHFEQELTESKPDVVIGEAEKDKFKDLFSEDFNDGAEQKINPETTREYNGSDAKEGFKKLFADDFKEGLTNEHGETSETKESAEKPEAEIEKIKCRNEELEGKTHPETNVPFVKKIVEVFEKLYEVVVPEFDSKFDAQLPEELYTASDKEQFKECNAQLKEAVDKDKTLKDQFNSEQLEQIQNGETPDGYTWHHDAEAGKMQLVDSKTHQKTGHTGGRTIWGGGSDCR